MCEGISDCDTVPTGGPGGPPDSRSGDRRYPVALALPWGIGGWNIRSGDRRCPGALALGTYGLDPIDEQSNGIHPVDSG
jgi:hypothetical protein